MIVIEVESETPEKTRAALRAARTAKRVKEVRVGFFSTARHENGSPIASIAFINEFGSPEQGIPERPFFRQSLRIAEPDVRDLLEHSVDPDTLAFAPALGSTLGRLVKAVVQRRIAALKNPPNAPYTVKKKGFDNPLIETSAMRRSVTYRVRL